ncbi:MAG TPA: DNA polymerase III subunit delta [Polyangiaceae bacterium]|nr:DNA polymerase III subunit delta [Polyangiaceae bacterium]
MTPDQAVDQAKRGKLLPVYVVAGEERMLRDRVVAEVRASALEGGLPDFNEDKFTAGEVDADTVISAARTAPMFARRRFVVVRGAERWDAEGTAGAPFDRLADYAAAPVESSCLVIVATRLDGRRRLAVLARRQGFLVACEPLDGRALPAWIASYARDRGNPMDRDVCELLAALVGPDLSAVADAVERLSLYVGAGAAIDEGAVGACVARIRTADTWALVDAVGGGDLGRALQTLADAFDPRERGLPLLGALAWSIRQLARYQAATMGGAPSDEAARRAGAFQPQRARELAVKSRAVRPREVERWLLVLAETDLALKSSRRAPDAILEEMLTRLCRPRAAATR